MKQTITIREVTGEKQLAHFKDELQNYHKQDIFPDPDSDALPYFLDDEAYWSVLLKANGREHDRCRFLFFEADKTEVGFALITLYDSEDGKCMIMEFCIYPEHRNKGIGTGSAEELFRWASERGAAYFELNCNTGQRKRFWKQLGFTPNGIDEWQEPLMIRPPAETAAITVEMLSDPENWQLKKLLNGYLSEIGEEGLTEEKTTALKDAIRSGQIRFFLAKRGYRAVGICSIALHFSTFNCGQVGIFEDFYIEPAFRHQKIARLLTEAVFDWCRKNGVGSLSVTCAPCDEAMYQKLGFDLPLGKTLTMIPA